MSGLEIVAVGMSVIAVYLTMRRHIYCWGFNFVAAALYAYLFYVYQLYGETLLQLFFMSMAVYGVLQWRQAQQIIVKNIVLQVAIRQMFLTALAGLVFGLGLKFFTAASVPLLDAQLAAFSLLATYWTSRGYLATWLLWIVLDMLYVGLFIYKDLYLTAALYAAFVLLATIGYWQWSKIKKITASGEPLQLKMRHNG